MGTPLMGTIERSSSITEEVTIVTGEDTTAVEVAWPEGQTVLGMLVHPLKWQEIETVTRNALFEMKMEI